MLGFQTWYPAGGSQSTILSLINHQISHKNFKFQPLFENQKMKLYWVYFPVERSRAELQLPLSNRTWPLRTRQGPSCEESHASHESHEVKSCRVLSPSSCRHPAWALGLWVTKPSGDSNLSCHHESVWGPKKEPPESINPQTGRD